VPAKFSGEPTPRAGRQTPSPAQRHDAPVKTGAVVVTTSPSEGASRADDEGEMSPAVSKPFTNEEDSIMPNPDLPILLDAEEDALPLPLLVARKTVPLHFVEWQDLPD
jgi:hypothetical protein